MEIREKTKNGGWPDGVGMIYLAMSPWKGMWKNRHQLMSRFAATMPVMYVEPWIRLRRLRRQGFRYLWDRGRQQENNVEQPVANLFVYRSPVTAAVSGSRFVKPITGRYWLRGVREAAGNAGITRPILWLSLPEMYFAVGQMNELLSIYHVVDEYGGYARQTPTKVQRLREQERKMLESVDLSIVVSPELADTKAVHGRNIEVIENAVDFEAFSHAMQKGETPSDISAIPGPRFGYSGLIGQRLNLELMIRIAKERPDWSLVFVGKADETDCKESLSELRQLPNAHFLGEKSVEEVPAYVAAFDVGLLPYNLNLETNNISPLKMYEYLAVGIPVVSTSIPSAKRNERFLGIATSDDEFIAACDASLESRDDESRAFRRSHARANTWDSRVDQATGLLQQMLCDREAGAR